MQLTFSAIVMQLTLICHTQTQACD